MNWNYFRGSMCHCHWMGYLTNVVQVVKLLETAEMQIDKTEVLLRSLIEKLSQQMVGLTMTVTDALFQYPLLLCSLRDCTC